MHKSTAWAFEQYENLKNDMEENLTAIWRELLNINQISRHDNFFALGGHSLLAVELLRELPPNLITGDSTKITPQMLQLINLSQEDIGNVVSQTWFALQLMHQSIIDHETLEKLQSEIHVVMDGKIEEFTTRTLFRNFVGQTRAQINTAEHTQFFTEMLGDIDEPTLPFGLQYVDQSVSNEVNEAHLKLSQELNEQLRAHARNLQVSLASICHLAWAQLLAQASGREAIVFGTVVGHLHAEKKNNTIMGPMINTLPMRLNIDEGSVEAVVRDTNARLIALLAHQHTPLVLAQRCSGVPTDSPLFITLLNYRRIPKTKEINTLRPGVNFLGIERQSKYPLALSIDDNGRSLHLSIQVMSPISAARVCAYMQQSLESLVDALTHAPQKSVRNLTAMPSEERSLLLHTWNQTTIAQSPICCLHQLFEAQVECNGEAIALKYEGQNLSYSELNIRANRLAHYIIGHGVKPDDRIALCVGRGTAMIVGILGILKAGCAYVPQDPTYPSQRLTNILHDADPILILADATGRDVLENHQISVINLDKSLPSDLPVDNPDTAKLGLTPAHLAYLIYTSGSTGTPKGVMVEHRQIVRHLEATHDRFDFNKQDKWCSFHSISFDISLSEIWGALRYGCELFIVPYHIKNSLNEFYDWICTKGITVLIQTPSVFKIVMRAKGGNSRNDQLRYVICGGERLESTIVKDWYENYDKSGQTILVNRYGPTEAVLNTTYGFCDSTISKKLVIPIGRPLCNKSVYILDSQGGPVPIGAAGEIYIGGIWLSRGYLNRHDFTAERFLPNPFSEIPEARMYRTGDLARYLPDGNLVFLGRIDQQVKIRGFRIELGEIETRLVEHPDVRGAVVQPYGAGSDARLIAYVVAESDVCLVQDLRSYLSNLLPDYMVPAAIVCLPSFPLTPNGKLNRRELPTPGDEAFVREQYEAPLGEIEMKLSDIWSELLNIGRISRNDNFFDLGGHSLLVMHFVSKAKCNDIHIDAQVVFSFPILKNLAEEINNRCSKRFYSDLAIPVRQHGHETPLFLLPGGWGGISYAFELAHEIDKAIPVYVMPWSSPESKQPSSIEEMARAMIPRIKKVQPSGPCAIAGYSSGGLLAYEIAKQLINSGYPVSFLGLFDTYAPRSSMLSESEIFLKRLRFIFPVFETYDDPRWWTRVSKLTLNESIGEIRKTNIDLSNIDIEWEASLSVQCFGYQNICAKFQFDLLPIKIHLFKTATFDDRYDHINNGDLDEQKKLFNSPKLGWEKYNLSTNFNIIPVVGDHFTMMTDPINRSILGKKMTTILLLQNH